VLAFLWFARAGVDAAVVEVGLGGRLDATNVLVPRAAVVTTIGYDHERYLGSTLDAIAGEKAGIFKPSVPAVVGRVSEPAAGVLSAVARQQGSPLRRFGEDFRAVATGETFDYVGRRTIRGLRCGLSGRFQIDNAAVALAGLEDGGWLDAIADEVVREGVRTVRWPGRLEVIGDKPCVVLDGAHNPSGVDALCEELPAIAAGRPIHLVFGVLADKRWPRWSSGWRRSFATSRSSRSRAPLAGSRARRAIVSTPRSGPGRAERHRGARSFAGATPLASTTSSSSRARCSSSARRAGSVRRVVRKA